jgi:hypothetical protein
LCILKASGVMGGALEHIAPHLSPAAGRQGDVILARQSGQGRDEPHHNSRWHAEGIVERLALEARFNPLMRHRLWN